MDPKILISSLGTTRLISWPNGMCYSYSLQSLVVSLIQTSRIHFCLFLDWRRTVSSKFFNTLVHSVSAEEFVLPCHARSVLSRLCCNKHSLLLNFYFYRIGRIKISSCSACGHFILHCSATNSFRRLNFGDSLISLRPLVQALGSCSVSGAQRYSAMPPSLGRGWVATTATTFECCEKVFVGSMRSISSKCCCLHSVFVYYNLINVLPLILPVCNL